jgi:type I restriction enzyme S subunit
LARDGWREVSLGDIAKLVRGISYRSSDYCDEDQGHLFFNLKCVEKGGGLSYRGIKFYNGPVRDEQFVSAGDLLIAQTDLTRGMDILGAPALVPPLPNGRTAAISLDLCKVVPVRDEVVPTYLYYALMTAPMREAMKSLGTGTTVVHLNTKAALQLRLVLPPVEEQRRIVDLLSAVDVLYASAVSEVQASSTVARKLRGHFLSQQEVTHVRLADAVQVTMGRQRSPKQQTGDHLVPYLRAANVKDGFLDLDDVLQMNFTPAEQAKFQLLPGDVLVTEGCGSLSQIGANAVWHEQLDGTVCFQNTLLRLRAIEGKTLAPFVAHWARYAFESRAFSDVSSGTNIFHIGAVRAAEMPFPLLPMDRQGEVAQILGQAQSTAQFARERASSILAVRTALLSRLLSGGHEMPGAYDRFLLEDRAKPEPLEPAAV